MPIQFITAIVAGLIIATFGLTTVIALRKEGKRYVKFGVHCILAGLATPLVYTAIIGVFVLGDILTQFIG